MQIGAHVGDVIGLGLITVFCIATQPPFYKLIKPGFSLRSSTLKELGHRWNSAVDGQSCEDDPDVFWIQPFDLSI